ncbi:hypothetical protein QO003_001966 [Arthrobacter silviterrae]|uniref:Uncharacterized protein n=1 Tax=Arthrobacter silviterrae TaxID=2026658 RepID=A0ABX0DI28_9MICC|nr:hypothetical protein [Arthrobacter silviterrae]MDQ0277663.1 hypothetical protein [Arthrobacter silviterrae]NGN84260.1 hypothetical protein [Arthrobacter silviterrae]
MLGINWAEALILGAVGAIIIAYLYLRLVKWGPRPERALDHIRNHALWTGIIAWALSSEAAANRAGIMPAPQSAGPSIPLDAAVPNPWDTIPLAALIGPVVAVLVVHLLGQLSWPAPKSPKRVAVLEYRRVRDFIEPALGWTVLGVFLLSAGTVAYLAFAPGHPVRLAGSPTEGTWYGPLDGRVPGWMLGTALGASLAILAAGTFAVMALIASRRSLEALDSVQNKTLRTVGMNRLLRISATMASGFAAIAGNYLVQLAPGSTATSSVNWLALTNLAVLASMLFWKPPFIEDVASPAASGPHAGHGPGRGALANTGLDAARLADSTIAAVVPAAVVGGFAGALLMTWLGWMGPAVVATVFILLTYAGLEVLLRRNYATPGLPHKHLSKSIPWPLYAALIIAAAGLAIALNQVWRARTEGLGTSAGWNGTGGPATFCDIPLLCALVVAAAGALAAWQVLRRPALGKAWPALDGALRRRALFRIGRTVASGWFTVLGAVVMVLPNEADSNPLAPQPNLAALGAVCIALAALMLVFPVRAVSPADFLPESAETSADLDG